MGKHTPGYVSNSHYLHANPGIAYDKNVYKAIFSYVHDRDVVQKLSPLYTKVLLHIRRFTHPIEIKRYLALQVKEAKNLLHMYSRYALTSQLDVHIWSQGLIDRLLDKEATLYIDEKNKQGYPFDLEKTIVTNIIIFLILEDELKYKPATFSQKVMGHVRPVVKAISSVFSLPRVDEEMGVDKRPKDEIVLEGGGMYSHYIQAAQQEAQKMRDE